MRKPLRGANLRIWLLPIACCSLTAISCHDNAVERRASERNESISVCEIFRSPGSYHGRIIRVRAAYYKGLRDPACPGPYNTADRAWPRAFNVVGTDLLEEGDPPAPFQTDFSNWSRVRNVIREEALKGRRCEVWIDVVGQVRAFRAGQSRIGGFGHLGSFPAELIAERIESIEVRDKPTYDYTDALRSRDPRSVDKR
jgi:hypothetical protein